MIQEFIDFTSEVIPSISPYTKEGIKSALEQFRTDNKKFHTTMDNNFEILTQGDILENIPFYNVNKDTGKLQVYRGRGLVLNNTCDCDRDENILIAPFIPIHNLTKDRQSVVSNRAYGYLYLPDNNLDDSVVDFSLTNTYKRELIVKNIEDNKITKFKSLNAYGYYLFICKLTVYLLRPEDVEVNARRIGDVNKN